MCGSFFFSSDAMVHITVASEHLVVFSIFIFKRDGNSMVLSHFFR